MIEQILLEELAQYIDSRVTSADVTIDGSTYEVGLRRSIIDGDKVRKHIYLTQQHPHGTVTQARLLGKDNEVLATREDEKEHKEEKGLLLEFRFQVKEQEV